MNDIPTPCRHIELGQYADNNALVATSKHPALLVKYLETHLSKLEIWLREWRIAINVGKSAAVLLTTRRIPPPRSLRILGEEIRWEEKVKYLGVTLDRRLTWSSHIDQVINNKKYLVFAPMGRFQLELIYLYFPPSSHVLYVCLCPVGLSLL